MWFSLHHHLITSYIVMDYGLYIYGLKPTNPHKPTLTQGTSPVLQVELCHHAKRAGGRRWSKLSRPKE